MISIVRTNSANSDFLILVRKLDAELAISDGDDHVFYSQFNSLEKIRHVVLAYVDGEPAGCGAIKEFSAHFMTRRFDREDGATKHHIQTFCALRHFDFNAVTSYSYEQLFQTMRELKLSYPAAEQMYRRMVFNVLARNCDDHTKNFAFRLKKDGRWELAPAYDICHAYKPEHKWVSQHALSINGRRSNITREDLLKAGSSANIKKSESVIMEINETVSRWKQFADEAAVSPALRNEIAGTLINLK
jgi:serine/threonine-protein kinase HipA